MRPEGPKRFGKRYQVVPNPEPGPKRSFGVLGVCIVTLLCTLAFHTIIFGIASIFFETCSSFQWGLIGFAGLFSFALMLTAFVEIVAINNPAAEKVRFLYPSDDTPPDPLRPLVPFGWREAFGLSVIFVATLAGALFKIPCVVFNVMFDNRVWFFCACIAAP